MARHSGSIPKPSDFIFHFTKDFAGIKDKITMIASNLIMEEPFHTFIGGLGLNAQYRYYNPCEAASNFLELILETR